MYSHERAHIQLRLLCAIEVLLLSDMYDVDSPDYYAPFHNDDRLVLLRYTDFVLQTVRLGCYSDTLTVLCISSVIQKLIQMRWPVA